MGKNCGSAASCGRCCANKDKEAELKFEKSPKSTVNRGVIIPEDGSKLGSLSRNKKQLQEI